MLPLCVVVEAQTNLEDSQKTLLSLVESLSIGIHLDASLKGKVQIVVFSNAASPEISDALEAFVNKESNLSPVFLRWIRSPIPLNIFSFIKKFSVEIGLNENDFFLWLNSGDQVSARFFSNLLKYTDSRIPTIVFPVLETPVGKKNQGYKQFLFFKKLKVLKANQGHSFETAKDLYPWQNKLLFQLKELGNISKLLMGEGYEFIDFRHAPRINPNLVIWVPGLPKFFNFDAGDRQQQKI